MQIFIQWLRYAAATSFIIFTFNSSHAQESTLIVISGQVIDQTTRETLPGVSVSIKGTVAGTTTNNRGEFALKTRLKFPLTLVFTM